MMFSVSEFCRDHRISRGTFYKLLADGRGPRIAKIGRRTLISAEAAEEWRRRIEQQPAPKNDPGTKPAPASETPKPKPSLTSGLKWQSPEIDGAEIGAEIARRAIQEVEERYAAEDKLRAAMKVSRRSN